MRRLIHHIIVYETRKDCITGERAIRVGEARRRRSDSWQVSGPWYPYHFSDFRPPGGYSEIRLAVIFACDKETLCDVSRTSPRERIRSISRNPMEALMGPFDYDVVVPTDLRGAVTVSIESINTELLYTVFMLKVLPVATTVLGPCSVDGEIIALSGTRYFDLLLKCSPITVVCEFVLNAIESSIVVHLLMNAGN